MAKSAIWDTLFYCCASAQFAFPAIAEEFEGCVVVKFNFLSWTKPILCFTHWPTQDYAMPNYN